MRTGSGSDTDTENETRPDTKNEERLHWELNSVWNRNRNTEGLELETDPNRNARSETEIRDSLEPDTSFWEKWLVKDIRSGTRLIRDTVKGVGLRK